MPIFIDLIEKLVSFSCVFLLNSQQKNGYSFGSLLLQKVVFVVYLINLL